ncbi:ABC transporter substrate-binding protein [Labrys monachus]|uniref:Branched-chain amino acid transport system substrate-binding protein n=1 Tax=Labrys monachus TaxID=217067 RepID=A0ABU0FB69_9HYPH|nr:ABC transporter substrate-binding protein [Labrys monachus]MDQ0391364.1 branched-chain amino acid transport system substrate-binding protein [Labrys monachus]
MPSSFVKILAFAGALGLAGLAGAPPAAAQDHKGEQLYPLFTYRTGPYAPSFIPFGAGNRDYLTYVNDVEGGVDGVKIFIQECETAYTIERGIECYERYKNGYDGALTAAIYPHSSGLDVALTDKARIDKVPIVSPGGGQNIATDGRIFPYQYPLMFDYWSEAQIVVDYIASKVGGYDKLKGVKIVTLYHDSGYGRDTIEPLGILSKKYGFEDIQIPVPHPGEQQQTQWQQIRRAQADWVFLRGWGVMTPVAIKTAARVGFPADHIIGDIWSGSEDDARPAGGAAKGYLAVSVFPPGTDYDILRTLKAKILDAGKSDLKDNTKFGTVYYNYGVIEAITFVEALHVGHRKFGNRPLAAEEGRWALENLDIDAKRIADLGAKGLISPLKTSPDNHKGETITAKVIQWDGAKWNTLTDWIKADTSLFADTIRAKAAAYAQEKGITPQTNTN